MAKATLPLQAFPPDKRPKALPEPFESLLPSGTLQKWRMPDPFAIVAFDGVIPDPLTAAVITLLKNEKSYTDENDPARHRNEAANIKGMYALGAAMAVEPKWDASVEYGSGDTLGRREIGYQDAISLYQLFRFSTRTTVIPSPDANEPERAANAPSDSDGVRTDASAAVGD